MSILMAGLQETQMWAVYQMGMGNDMPSGVTKEDLICIIAFLFKQLDWIDEESPSHTSVESQSLADSQNSDSQTQQISVEQLALAPNQSDENRPSKGNGVKNTCVEVAEDSNIVDQNGDQTQAISQMENNDSLLNSEKWLGNDTLRVRENSLTDPSQLEFECSLCDQKFSKESFVAAHMWLKHKTAKLQENSVKNFSCSHCDNKCYN